jgi:hypothetical protein
MAVKDPSVHSTSSGRAPAAKPTLSRVAWIPNEEMDYATWVQEGGRIGSFSRGSAWWLGDWLHYGAAKWGERYAKAAKITGYDPKTLRNMRYVASRFDLSLRRDNLTWSHHALLASFGPGERAYWLDRSVNDGLSVDDLRMELRRAQKQREEAGAKTCVGDHGEAAEGRALLCPKCGYEIDADSLSPET